MIQNFKPGDIVVLASDIKQKWPMTIVKQYSKNEYQVTWMTKTGIQKFNGLPAESLKKANILE